MSNHIEIIRDEILAAVPEARAELDPPGRADLPWFLDLYLDAYNVTVEWRPGLGFGVTSDDKHGLGEGPDEFRASLYQTVGRVLSLLATRGRTSPQGVRLRDLRRMRGLSQREVGSRMGVGQGEVSKIEGRSDLRVSTLREMAEAMGGRLIIKMDFPGHGEREVGLGKVDTRRST
ncbi:MAG: helix-turn-helix domain-containing protein [Gemmataceae bacterium]